MANINWTTTDKAALSHGLKALVYGRPGVGKTVLTSTLPAPLIISCESGLLSLRKFQIPVATIETFEELAVVYDWIVSDNGRTFQSVALDSITEIAETCLTAMKEKFKDGRKAYGEMQDVMLPWIRRFRDLQGVHVLFTAKQELVETAGGIKNGCAMPGRTLTRDLPYFFDEVFHMDVAPDPTTGQPFRFLRTQPDNLNDAKDRSGALELYEVPDMTAIINKISNI